MKSILKSFTLTVAFFSIFISMNNSLFAQQTNRFEFVGRVFADESKAKDVMIKVYDGNKCISKYETRSSGKFIFNPLIEKHYTLQFEKEGYVTKRIIVSTAKTRGLNEDVKTYKFDLSLEKIQQNKDYSLHDFPAAIISLNLDKKEFEFNKSYTESWLNDIALKANGSKKEEQTAL